MKPDLNEYPVPNGYVYLGRGDEIPEEHRTNPPEEILLWHSRTHVWGRRLLSHRYVLQKMDYYAAPKDSPIALHNQKGEVTMHDQFIEGAIYQFINFNGPDSSHAQCNIGDRFTVHTVDDEGDALTNRGCVLLNRLRNGQLRLISTPENKEPQMNTQDAHKQLTKDFIEVNPPGTRVRILRGWSEKETWHYEVAPQGSAPTEGEAEITGLFGDTNIKLGNDFVYPWFVLEPITAKPVRVELNDEYEAEVTPKGIIVDCQTFPLSVIDGLIEARNKVQGES